MNFFLMQVLSLSVFVLIQSVPVATPRIRSPTFCPQSSSGNVTLDVFGMVNKTAYAQLGVWHRLPCPSYQQGENVSGASWYMYMYKEPGRQHLLTYHSKEGTFLPEHERYGPSFDFGLAIKGIEEGDAGRYQCEVLFGQIDESLKTVEEINIKVIGDSFQPSISHKSSMAIHEREQRRTVITCPYNPQTPNTFVVYWSLENVATMHNEIIGAKFFNGTVAQNQFCTDYSIGSNGSLTVNTWNSIGENQVTFWCHVFKRDGTPSSCSIKVYLRQESLLYLQKESKEVHPCSSLNPGSVAQDVFGMVNKTAYAQLGIWHRLPCPSYQQGENVIGVTWYMYKEPGIQLLISIHSGNLPLEHKKYGHSSDFSLVIKGIEEGDAGRYQCEVVCGRIGDSLTKVKEINIKVIGDSFQPNISDNSSNVTLQRGQRQKVTCPCDPQTLNTSVVYWSLGKGVTTPTQIIGARFFDGTVVQIQFGADYSIGSDGSLTINSWSSIEEDQVTFWCHVFKRDGTLSSCSTEAHILQDQPLNLALNASSALYLREGFKQILPCTNWRPGVPVCGIQWYLLSNSLNSTVVKYNLSSDFLQIDAAYMYDLASNFSLVIKAVESTHAGRFTCVPDCARSKPVEYMYLDTNVIGDLFPACRNYTASSVEVTNGQQIVLPCECAQQTRNASVTALFWSMGEGVTTGTSVNCAPLENGSMICSDGYSVSSNWSLTVSRLNDSGRFWCHVFWTNDTLSNCYTDVKFIDTSAGPCTSAAIIVIIVVLGLVASGYFMWNRRRSRRARDGRSEIIENVHVTLTDIKTIPTRSDAEDLMVQNLYTPPELFRNFCAADGVLRDKLPSEAEIFEGYIRTQSGRGVVIQGKSGSGKSVLLEKLKYDWKKKQELSVEHIQASDIRLQEYRKAPSSSVSVHVVLVDDCSDEKDFDSVMETFKDEGPQSCRVVMTTRSATLAQKMSQKYDLGYVQITGFSADNARKYSQSELEKFPNTKNIGDNAHKYNPSELEKFPNTKNIGDNARKYSPSELEKFPNTKNIGDRDNVVSYLDDGILFAGVDCLPGFLRALHQYLVVKEKHGFHFQRTFRSLITGMFAWMFDRLDTDHTLARSKCHPLLDTLTDNQNDFLATCGSVVLSRIFDGCEIPHEMLKSDFIASVENGEDVLHNGKRVGLLCEQGSQWENGDEKAPLISSDYAKVKFALGIFSEFCAGKHMARDIRKSIERIIQENSEDIEKLSNVFVFAGSESYDVACRIVECLENIIDQKGLWRKGSLKDVIHLQKLTELCLELNFEGMFGGELNNKLQAILHGEKLALIGISSRKLRLLAYCIKHMQPRWLKSIELFCVEKPNWYEFKDCVKCLYPSVIFVEDSEVEDDTSNSESREVTEHKQLESRERYLPKFPSDKSDNSVPRTVQCTVIQQLFESQSGECHSSSAATELIDCLSHQLDINAVVLLGPVIGSQQIRVLARHLPKFEFLQKIDLRLNTEMDDEAFKSIMIQLFASSCPALVDLRLSLYRVTGEGFQDMQEAVRDTVPLRRLRTLYLLHVSVVEPFCNFLRETLQYMDSLQCVHVSALAEEEKPGIPDTCVELIRRLKPNLREFYVDGRDAYM